MLQQLSEKVRACQQYALDAKRKADVTADPVSKADFLAMEKRWLSLAQSYQLTERLADFSQTTSAWRQAHGERPRGDERPNDALGLQKIVQEGNVDALFERMWLASIVEFSDDAIISRNLDGI